MFVSPDASRAIADQAQQLSGISSTILKKLLPVLAGIIISSLMKTHWERLGEPSNEAGLSQSRASA
jgi:hypothetical protein